MTSKLHFKQAATLADLQKYIADMEAERGFLDLSLLQTYLLLVEEVGELAKCIRKQETAMRTDSAKTYSDNAGHEIADIVMVVTALANRLSVDMEQAIREKEEMNKQRVWK